MKEQTRKEMKEKLAGYRRPAPDVAWTELEKALAPHRQPAVAKWGKLMAVAAMVLLAVGLGWRHLSPEEETGNPQTAMSDPVSSTSSAEPPVGSSAEPSETLASAGRTPTHTVKTPLDEREEKNKWSGEASSAKPTVSDRMSAEGNGEKDASLPPRQAADDETDTHPSPAETKGSDAEKKDVDDRKNRIDEPTNRPEGDWMHTIPVEGNRLTAQVYYSNSMSGGSSVSSFGPSLSPANTYGNAYYDPNANGDVPLYDQDLEVEERARHHQPIRLGVSVRYCLGRRWSIESGLSYTYLASDITRSVKGSSYEMEQRLSYLGVPLNVGYQLWGNRHFNVYASAGGMVEMMVSGKRVNVENHFRERIGHQPLQFSVIGAAGVEFLPGGSVSIFAEPGIAYHFAHRGSIPTFYQDKPFCFNLNLGLRLNFNK